MSLLSPATLQSTFNSRHYVSKGKMTEHACHNGRMGPIPTYVTPGKIVSCVGVLLSGEWVFDISLAWYAVNLKGFIKRDDC